MALYETAAGYRKVWIIRENREQSIYSGFYPGSILRELIPYSVEQRMDEYDVWVVGLAVAVGFSTMPSMNRPISQGEGLVFVHRRGDG